MTQLDFSVELDFLPTGKIQINGSSAFSKIQYYTFLYQYKHVRGPQEKKKPSLHVPKLTFVSEFGTTS